MRTEYRVMWRRFGWSWNSADKSRTFATEHGMRQFVGRLDRPDLTEINYTVHVRECGPWQPLEVEL